LESRQRPQSGRLKSGAPAANSEDDGRPDSDMIGLPRQSASRHRIDFLKSPDTGAFRSKSSEPRHGDNR